MSTKPKTIGMRFDIETKSREPIKHGVYRYTEDDDFEVLLIAYSMIRAYPGDAIKLSRPALLNLYNQRDVDRFADLLVDPGFQKHAYNAAFERVCMSRWLEMGDGKYLDPEGWHCTAIRANVNGVFGTLDDVGRALRSPTAKDKEGKRLIRLFSVPSKTGEFVTPAEAPADFAKYGDYCKQDVVAEAMVANLLGDVPAEVQAEYEADQRINDRGFKHFKRMAVAAVAAVTTEKARVMGELKAMTGIDNPNSGPQFNTWLIEQGYPMTSLDKDHREEAVLDPMAPDIVKAALTLKGQASMTSVTKHQAALNTRCHDGRIRGSLQFYGAHTGREAGRGIQPQNLPRHEATKAEMISLLKGTAGADAPLIAKGSVRGSIVPRRGCVFIVPDYNAIEARCLGWLTGEDWVNAEFAGDGKIYEATAATMFGVDKAQLVAALKACGKCGKCSACSVRAKAKVSNLALGYAGGAGALVTMGAEKEGIDIGNYAMLHAQWVVAGRPGKFHEWNRELHDYPELIRLRDLYREASPSTTRFWKLNAKAWDLSSLGQGARYGQNGVVSIIRDGKHNRMVLPSGRSIWYRFARSTPDPTNPDRIDRRTFIGKSAGVGHFRTDTHGGKLTENVTQAVARDVLFDLIMKIEAKTAAGWPARTVLHVHDEVVLEVPEKHADQVLADTLGLMAVPPDWAPGLAVQGAGGIMERYGK